MLYFSLGNTINGKHILDIIARRYSKIFFQHSPNNYTEINTFSRHTLRSEMILATESSSKIMKNAFYFTLKALFVVKTFKFLF